MMFAGFVAFDPVRRDDNPVQADDCLNRRFNAFQISGTCSRLRHSKAFVIFALVRRSSSSTHIRSQFHGRFRESLSSEIRSLVARPWAD